jgi:single-strand DNA-binding protein
MNKVVLTGFLGHDAELTYSKGEGKAIVKMSLGVTEGFGDKKKTQYFNITAFGYEKLCEYLTKGSKVAISGKLQNSSYEKDGVKKYKTEIIADNYGGVELLSSKAEKQQVNMPADAFGGGFDEDITPIEDDGDMPF